MENYSEFIDRFINTMLTVEGFIMLFILIAPFIGFALLKRRAFNKVVFNKKRNFFDEMWLSNADYKRAMIIRQDMKDREQEDDA